MKDDAVEQEIQSKGLTAPRITPGMINASIVAEYTGTADRLFQDCPQHPSLATLTICVLVLKNGFTVIGESACASPANFDADIGMRLAREDATRKIWKLEGYALRSRLAR